MMIITYIALSLLGILFALSVWANILLLKRLLFISENLDNLLYIIENYSAHLEEVYSMETFYGDATLENLLQHSKELHKDLEQFILDYEQEREEANAPSTYPN